MVTPVSGAGHLRRILADRLARNRALRGRNIALHPTLRDAYFLIGGPVLPTPWRRGSCWDSGYSLHEREQVDTRPMRVAFSHARGGVTE